MTRKATKKTQGSSSAPAAAPAAPPPDEMLLELENVETLLDELNEEQDTEICVWRAAGRDAPREVWLFGAPASAYTLPQLLDHLRDEFGGGDFRIRGRKGRRFLPGSKTLSVEKSRSATASAAPVAAAAPAPAPALDMVSLFMAQMKQNSDLMTAMMSSATRAPATSSLGFSDVIAAAQMMSGKKDTSAVGQLKELMELQGLMKGEGRETGDDGWMSVIKELAAPIAAAALAAPAPAAAPTAPAGPTTPPVAPPAPKAADAMAEMRAMLARLVKAARRDSPASYYAGVVVEEIGAVPAARLLSQENPVGLMARILPEVGAPELREWFDEFITEARDYLDSLKEEGAAPATSEAAPKTV